MISDKYIVMGHAYDLVCNLYTGGQNQKCKVAMFEHLQPGDRVLIAGAGHGLDAVNAARRGAQVTVVDISPTMIARFQRNIERSGTQQNIRTICGDILQFNELGQFDMVVANFFLNVFPRKMMMDILHHLVQLGQKDARVVIGDFCLPDGNWLSRGFNNLYWYSAVIPFYFIAGNAVHPVYNYPEILRQLGLKMEDKKYFRFLGFNALWSVMARKSAVMSEGVPLVTSGAPTATNSSY